MNSNRARVVKKLVSRAKLSEVSVSSRKTSMLEGIYHDDNPENNNECNVLHDDDNHIVNAQHPIKVNSNTNRNQQQNVERSELDDDPYETINDYSFHPQLEMNNTDYPGRYNDHDQSTPHHWNIDSQQPIDSNSSTSAFSLRDFLRACSMVQRISEEQNTTSETDAASETSSLTNTGTTVGIAHTQFCPEPNSPEPPPTTPSRRPSAAMSCQSPTELSTPHAATVPSQVDVINELVEVITTVEEASPEPRAEPITVRKPSISTYPLPINATPTSTPPRVSTMTSTTSPFHSARKTMSARHRNLSVAIPPTPRSEDETSLSSARKLKTTAKLLCHKGVQTWSMTPSVQKGQYNGSLDDFGDFAVSAKVDQATDIDAEALLHSDVNLKIETAEQEELLLLAQSSPFELALSIMQLRYSVSSLFCQNLLC
jgi:hypothetical protein